MNKASRLVAGSMSGTDFRTVMVGNRAYTLYPPSVKLIARALREFAGVEVKDDGYTLLSIVPEIPRNVPYVIRGLACLITGDVRCWRWRSARVARRLGKGTTTELLGALNAAVELINGADFFVCASLAQSVAKMGAKQK